MISMTLSNNLDKELTRFDMLTNQRMSQQRINQFYPSYNSARFPIALDPEPEHHQHPEQEPQTTHKTEEQLAQELMSESEPIMQWLNTEAGQAATAPGVLRLLLLL